MTETIEDSNHSDSATRFKALLLELHRGVDPSALYNEFHEVIHSASKKESAEIQKQLIIEGIPQELVEEWSRLHVGLGM